MRFGNTASHISLLVRDFEKWFADDPSLGQAIVHFPAQRMLTFYSIFFNKPDRS
jgi:hypothetical protein